MRWFKKLGPELRGPYRAQSSEAVQLEFRVVAPWPITDWVVCAVLVNGRVTTRRPMTDWNVNYLSRLAPDGRVPLMLAVTEYHLGLVGPLAAAYSATAQQMELFGQGIARPETNTLIFRVGDVMREYRNYRHVGDPQAEAQDLMDEIVNGPLPWDPVERVLEEARRLATDPDNR